MDVHEAHTDPQFGDGGPETTVQYEQASLSLSNIESNQY